MVNQVVIDTNLAIGALCIENDYLLLHNDKDFEGLCHLGLKSVF